MLHSLVGEGWEELACCMLVFLGYVQLKREEYSDYVSTCLKLLSYKSFDRKLEYSSMLMDIASNKLTERKNNISVLPLYIYENLFFITVITKEIKGGIFVLTIKYPEDVETKEYHIGDSISLSCTIRNNLPIEFYIQSIEVAFTTEEGDKSFVLRNDEGSPIKVVANGTNSEFSVVATTEFHGVYHFSNLSFVTGNLRLVCVNEAESESSVKAKAISVVPVPPTTDIIAKFPSKPSIIHVFTLRSFCLYFFA